MASKKVINDGAESLGLGGRWGGFSGGRFDWGRRLSGRGRRCAHKRGCPDGIELRPVLVEIGLSGFRNQVLVLGRGTVSVLIIKHLDHLHSLGVYDAER